MTPTPILIASIFLIVLGLIVNVAKKHDRIRRFIEQYILGGDKLFREEEAGRTATGKLGWDLIVGGAFLIVPSQLYTDGIIVFILVLLIFRLRKEYQKTVQESRDPRQALMAIKALRQREPLVAASQVGGVFPQREFDSTTVTRVLEMLEREVQDLRAGKLTV